MSIQAIDWAFKQQMAVAGMKLVLVALANYADDNGSCWPSQTSLASITSMSDRAVRSNVVRLEKDGFVRRDRHKGRFGNDLYTLCLDRKLIPQDRKNVPLEESSTGRDFRREPEESSENHRKNLPTIHQKKPVNEPSKGESAYAADPRRAPFTEFVFTTYAEKYGELITDKSDFEAQKSLLAKSKATLEELQQRWMRFLWSDDDFHRKQGHPFRYFCTNFNAFGGARASPMTVEQRASLGREELERKGIRYS